MILHGLDRHFLPVEDTCSQGCLHIGLFKDFWKVFFAACTAGGNHRDGDSFFDMFDKLDVKAAIGAVLINAVQEDLSGAQLLTRLYQLDCVDVTSFPTAFYGALIPAVFLLLIDFIT